MPQHLTDLRQWGTRAQHRGGRGVPQSVRVDLTQAGALAGIEDDHRHPARRQGPMRCLDPNEYIASFSSAGSATAQIVEYRLADVAGDREPFATVSLAPQYHLSDTPINIIQAEPRDFSGAQPEPRQ
jgi:hypothetical protein